MLVRVVAEDGEYRYVGLGGDALADRGHDPVATPLRKPIQVRR